MTPNLVPKNYGSNMPDLTNLQDVPYSGLFLLEIYGTRYGSGISNKTGNKWENCKINAVACDPKTGEQLGTVSVTVWPGSPEENHLCIFCKIFDQNTGEAVLGQPVHHTGTSKLTGEPYDFYAYDQLNEKSVFALVDFKGFSRSARGTEFATYDLIGFCDANGFSAYDLYMKSTQPCDKHLQFMQKLQSQPKPQSVQRQSAPAYGQQAPSYGYGQQASAYGQQQSQYGQRQSAPAYGQQQPQSGYRTLNQAVTEVQAQKASTSGYKPQDTNLQAAVQQLQSGQSIDDKLPF